MLLSLILPPIISIKEKREEGPCNLPRFSFTIKDVSMELVSKTNFGAMSQINLTAYTQLLEYLLIFFH
jgi:hypothetical protein